MTRDEAVKIMEAFALLHRPTGIEKVDQAIQVLYLKEENRRICKTCTHFDIVCKIDDAFVKNPDEFSCGAHSPKGKK